ncbi:MAG: phytoene/squalene synthase family protein [Verrucomicrobiales bacterium]
MSAPSITPPTASGNSAGRLGDKSSGNYLLNDLLRDVSRSFFLTLKFLPQAVRHQIGLAYLLARATDTVADTELIPVDRRLESLRELQSAIQVQTSPLVDFQRFTSHQANPSERILLERINEAIALLRFHTPEADRRLIQEVLEVITSGQSMDLIRFGTGTYDTPAYLASDAELADYTWRVAGCVGEFWTKICISNMGDKDFRFSAGLDRGHDASTAAGDNLQWLIKKGISYGQGLQYVNILRDIPADLKNGRCYIPIDAMESIGLAPKDLANPVNWPRFQPLYEKYLQIAENRLADGWQYTTALPKKWIRLRLACAWPILIGIKTIQKLRNSNVLESRNRVKINRAEVRSILWKTVVFYPLSSKWERLFSREKRG